MKSEQWGVWVKLERCPVCGKEFVPAPLHAYKDQRARTKKLVCSYTCMRKSERMEEYRQKKKGKGARSQGAVRCIDTGEIYPSAYAAYTKTGTCYSTILEVCRGKRATASGLRWEFVEGVIG